MKASHKQKLQAMYRALEEMDKKSIGDQEQVTDCCFGCLNVNYLVDSDESIASTIRCIARK